MAASVQAKEAVTQLALKAEVVLALQLVTRHRTPRVAFVLVLAVVFATIAGAPPDGGAARRHAALFVAAALGAFAGARLLARGGPLWAARRAAVSAFIPVLGRVLGVLVVLGPVVVVVAAPMLGSGAGAARVTFVAVVLGVANAAMTMAATPFIGAASAAALGLLAAWRAAGWLAAGDRGDPWLLLGGIVAALCVSAWAVERFSESARREGT